MSCLLILQGTATIADRAFKYARSGPDPRRFTHILFTWKAMKRYALSHRQAGY